MQQECNCNNGGKKQARREQGSKKAIMGTMLQYGSEGKYRKYVPVQYLYVVRTGTYVSYVAWVQRYDTGSCTAVCTVLQ